MVQQATPACNKRTFGVCNKRGYHMQQDSRVPHSLLPSIVVAHERIHNATKHEFQRLQPKATSFAPLLHVRPQGFKRCMPVKSPSS